MNKVNIVYYSFTGNTLRMVKAFEKGLQEAGVPFKSYISHLPSCAGTCLLTTMRRRLQ